MTLARRSSRAAAFASTRTSISSPTRSSAGTTHYSVLRERGREAVRAHPGKYASGVLDTVWQQLSKSYFRAPPAPQVTAAHPGRTGTAPAATDRGRADPGGPERLDLTARQQHPRRLDVGDAPSLRLQQAGAEPTVRRDRARARLAVPGAARTGGATPSSRSASNQLSRWFPRPILWIAARPGRALLAAPARSARRDRAGARGAPRDRPQRSRPVRRPALRAAGGSGVRPVRRGRSPRSAWTRTRRDPLGSRRAHEPGSGNAETTTSATRSAARPSTSPTTSRAARARSSASSPGWASARSIPATTSSNRSAR